MEEEERKTHRGRDVRLLTYGASSERKALGTLLYSTLFPGFNDDIEAVSYKNSVSIDHQRRFSTPTTESSSLIRHLRRINPSSTHFGLLRTCPFEAFLRTNLARLHRGTMTQHTNKPTNAYPPVLTTPVLQSSSLDAYLSTRKPPSRCAALILSIRAGTSRSMPSTRWYPKPLVPNPVVLTPLPKAPARWTIRWGEASPRR